MCPQETVATRLIVPSDTVCPQGTSDRQRVIHLYSGTSRPGDVQSCAEEAGLEYIGFDKVQGQDVRNPATRERVIRMCREGGHLTAGPNCRSFSSLRDIACEPTRSRSEPWGLDPMPGRWRAYIDGENYHITLTAEAAMAVFEGGHEFIIEQPADYGDPDHPLYKPSRAGSAHMFLTQPFAALIEATGARVVHLVQCSLGGLSRKPSDILASPKAAARLGWMEALMSNLPHGCPHKNHPRPAKGRNSKGASNASLAAAWPGPMCRGFIDGLVGDARLIGSGARGGTINDGPELHGAVRALLEKRRLAPERYIDLKHLKPATGEELAARPYTLMPIPRSPCQADRAEAGSEGSSDTSSQADKEVPPPGPLRLQSIPKRRHWKRLLEWMELATSTLRAWSLGQMAPAPPALVVTQRQVHRWARGKRYDARDPLDCKELEASTRETVFPGDKQMDRAAFRATAARYGWHDIDPDIVAQCGEGGVESRSTRNLDTCLRLHHPGVRQHFWLADEMMQKEVDDCVAGVAAGTLPFWPTNAMPRDMMWKDKYGTDSGGNLTVTPSPRLTFDPSSGQNSLNDGVPSEERTMQLPHLRSCAEAAAIGDTAAVKVGARQAFYAADIKSAFPHLVLQRLEWPLHCYIWVVHGRIQVRFFMRVTFGAAYAPQRFGRAMAPIDAAGLAAIAAHEVAHPYEPEIQLWVDNRVRLQRAGRMPQGIDQRYPRHAQRFVDDLQGSAPSSPTHLPQGLAHISVGARLTEAFGGTPAPGDSHAAVHLRIHIHNWVNHGITPAHDKTMCGDRLPTLGARVSVTGWRIDIPPVRVAVISQQIRDFQRTISTRPPADGPTARVDPFELERLVGRLGYVAQSEPDLLGTLQPGYAIPAAARRLLASHRYLPGSRAGTPTISIHMGKRLGHQLTHMLEFGISTVQRNRGVPLASAAAFPPITQPDVLTQATDASFQKGHPTCEAADDGVGGYAFSPLCPGTVFLISEGWTPRVRQALLNGARTRLEKAADPRRDNFSMPAAELFGTMAMAEAVAAHVEFSYVAAVGDCDPVEGSVAKSSSSRPQLNRMLARMRELTRHWLPVSVPRDLNLDADLLSHPSNLRAIIARIESTTIAGRRYRAEWLPIPPDLWAWLEAGLDA